MEDVHVPQENMLEGVTGLKGPFSCLKCVPNLDNHWVSANAVSSNARFGISFGVIGALEDCVARARDYALDRKQFNVPIGSFQLIQKKLADAHTEATIGLVSAIQLGRLKDAGTLAPEMVSMLKRNNCGKALQHSRILLDIFGGNAIVEEYHVNRHVQSLQVANTCPLVSFRCTSVVLTAICSQTRARTIFTH